MEQGPRRILIVDDDMAIRHLVSTLLRRDYQLAEAASGEEALEVAELFAPHLVLLDIRMPGIDGYETCRRLKSGPLGRGLQVVMISAKTTRQEQARAYEVGADDYVLKPFDPQELPSRVQLHFRLRAAMDDVASVQTEIEAHNSEIKRMAEEQTREIMAIQDVAVFMMAKLAESRDVETGEHLVRMRSYCQVLADQLRLTGPYAGQIDERFVADLYRSSPLHDIGKVGISDAVLLKPGPLTPDEFEVIKQHTTIGANVLDEAVLHSQGGGFLAMAAIIARFHHERFDGKGYPAGLVGEEIPLPARIVAVADVYDALTSVRPYKAAYDPPYAKETIESDSGHGFDPVVVEAFLARFDDFVTIGKRHGDTHRQVRGAMSFREYDLVTT